MVSHLMYNTRKGTQSHVFNLVNTLQGIWVHGILDANGNFVENKEYGVLTQADTLKHLQRCGILQRGEMARVSF